MSQTPDARALQVALRMEEDGRRLYQEAAAKVTNPLAKRTLAWLADWELDHIDLIKQFYSRLTGTGSWGEVKKTLAGRTMPKQAFRTLFEEARQNLDQLLSTDSEALEAYKLARDFENKAVGFYNEQLRHVTDSEGRAFYEFMVQQEKEHYEILDRSYRYLENPALWHAEEESWMFDGG
ncbi:MAG: ferritin family protein [candidate division KSB1 bacterium]|nr:ferritin family protein [candidate division KSB1 bacterium]